MNGSRDAGERAPPLRRGLRRWLASTLVRGSVALVLACSPIAHASEPVATLSPLPDRTDGEGPFARLVLRGAYLIDGTGTPTRGPVDIAIERDVISAIAPTKRDAAAGLDEPATRVIDAHGMYVLPGFVDTHLHFHSPSTRQRVPAESPPTRRWDLGRPGHFEFVQATGRRRSTAS